MPENKRAFRTAIAVADATVDPAVEEARRARVADAAIDALAKTSWRKVTLSGVAARAGVSKGVVTYWFPTKEALFLEALRRFHARYEARLFTIAQSDQPARERMRALIVVAFPSKAAVAAEVSFQIEVWSFAKEHPQVLTQVRDAYAAFQQACEGLLLLGTSEGYVATPSVEGLGLFVAALMDGLSLRLAFDPSLDIAHLRQRALMQLEQWFSARG